MTTAPIPDDVMALIAVTRNAMNHAEHVYTFGRSQTARKAVYEYHQVIQIMLQAYPEEAVKKAREEALKGRNIYDMTQVELWILSASISAHMLGMNV